MKIIDRKDKYCLKGEYYSVLEEVDVRLRYCIPSFFRKEVYSDLIDLFYRNQSLGKPISQVLVGGVDKFVDDIVDSFYSTLSKRKFMKYLVANAILFSIVTEVLYIVNSIVTKSSKAISFAVIVVGIIGFIFGILYFICNYTLAYKKSGLKKKIVQLIFILTPIYIVTLFGDLIYYLTKNSMFSKKLVISIMIVQFIIYTSIILTERIKRKSEKDGN